jgi:hypothetical protein
MSLGGYVNDIHRERRRTVSASRRPTPAASRASSSQIDHDKGDLEVLAGDQRRERFVPFTITWSTIHVPGQGADHGRPAGGRHQDRDGGAEARLHREDHEAMSTPKVAREVALVEFQRWAEAMGLTRKLDPDKMNDNDGRARCRQRGLLDAIEDGQPGRQREGEFEFTPARRRRRSRSTEPTGASADGHGSGEAGRGPTRKLTKLLARHDALERRGFRRNEDRDLQVCDSIADAFFSDVVAERTLVRGARLLTLPPDREGRRRTRSSTSTEASRRDLPRYAGLPDPRTLTLDEIRLLLRSADSRR